MDVLRQLLSVLLVFSLLGTALWLLRRGGRISFQGPARTRVQANTRSIVAVERLVLTPQHTLHIVRVNGREILVATHPQGCAVVTTVTEHAIGAKA
jgi:flagellar biogenesis protein FliO